MARQRYSIKESINRLLRLFLGETTNEIPGTLSGEILSEDAAWSDLAELFNDSLPNETLTVPDALRTALITDGFATGTVSDYVVDIASGTSPIVRSVEEINIGANLVVAGSGTVSYISAPDQSLLQKATWFIPVTGVTDNQFNVVGEIGTQASGQTADYTTKFGARNQHIFVLVNTITGGDIVTFSGTSVSESTAVPVTSDSETITIDSTADQYYQTSKKWLEIEGVWFGTGTAAVNYDVGEIGYLDFGNYDFSLTGFRADIKTNGTAADIGLRIRKVQDDGNGKMSVVTVENFGFDSVVNDGSWVDSLRTGGDDRSYEGTVNLAASNDFVVMKSTDYQTYFSSDENVMESSTKDEGIIIDFLGVPSGGISSVDHITLTIFYTWKI